MHLPEPPSWQHLHSGPCFDYASKLGPLPHHPPWRPTAGISSLVMYKYIIAVSCLKVRDYMATPPHDAVLRHACPSAILAYHFSPNPGRAQKTSLSLPPFLFLFVPCFSTHLGTLRSRQIWPSASPSFRILYTGSPMTRYHSHLLPTLQQGPKHLALHLVLQDAGLPNLVLVVSGISKVHSQGRGLLQAKR